MLRSASDERHQVVGIALGVALSIAGASRLLRRSRVRAREPKVDVFLVRAVRACCVVAVVDGECLDRIGEVFVLVLSGSAGASSAGWLQSVLPRVFRAEPHRNAWPSQPSRATAPCSTHAPLPCVGFAPLNLYRGLCDRINQQHAVSVLHAVREALGWLPCTVG